MADLLSDIQFHIAGLSEKQRSTETVILLKRAANMLSRSPTKDAERYQWLRNRDVDTIQNGGVFVGMTPKNVIITEDDLDEAIDAAMCGK